MRRAGRRIGWLAAMVAAGSAFPSQAQAQDFDCRGSALRVSTALTGVVEPWVASPEPACSDDADGLLTPTTVGPVTAAILHTSASDDAGAHAEAEAVGVVITLPGAPVIRASVLRASADARCQGGAATHDTGGHIAQLTIGSTTIGDTGDQRTIAVPGGVTVVLNERTDGTGSVTRRALHVFTTDPLSGAVTADIVVSEAIASASGCPAPPKPECSDDRDNDGDKAIDEQDPGCHTDGDPNNPDSYDPDDPSEQDEHTYECSDGRDNDGDKAVDEQDPGCHTDGDPNNPDSYDPEDDSELDDGHTHECSDGRDNDGDKTTDADDPDCHTDGDPKNPKSYDPEDDSEAGKDGGGHDPKK